MKHLAAAKKIWKISVRNRDVRRAACLRACVTASPVAGEGRPEERGRVEAPGGRSVRRGRTAVKPPNPVDGPEHACGVLLGTRGEPSPKPRDPRQRPWGSTLRALRQGGQRLGRWCDGQRTKEQRGARTPAHAKVGGVTVLAGLACSRFSRFIRPINAQPLSWVRCPSRKRARAPTDLAVGGARRAKVLKPSRL